MSDNGPPFSSKEFSIFCENWGVEHLTSSPHLPRSNGLAERTVQTVKKMLYKCQDDSTDCYTALLQYRTTRKEDIPSPSELLMGRVLRTKLPCLSESLKPKTFDQSEIEKKFIKRKENMSNYYNRNTVKLKPINVGEKIMFKKTPTSVWYPGTITDISKEPRSFIIQGQDGSTYRRNRQHVMNESNDKNESLDKTESDHFEDANEFSNDNEFQNGSDVEDTVTNGDNYVTRSDRVCKLPDRYIKNI